MPVNPYYDLGGKKHVFIDWDLVEPGYGVSWGGQKQVSWEIPLGIRLAVHNPRVDTHARFQADKPWEDYLDMMHSSLVEDEGKFRLYYVCWKRDDNQTSDPYVDPAHYMLAYAESPDGISWEKPNVGTIDFGGSTDNNLVYGMDVAQDRPVISPVVFIDPSASVDRRYKLVYRGRVDGVNHVYGAFSPDGILWTTLEEPIMSGYFSDTHNVVRYDPDKGRYVGYFRAWTTMESGRMHGRRMVAYAESDQFESWPTPEPIVAPDMHDGPDTDIYTNAHTPWPGADAQLMFPAFYQRGMDITELHMMTSRDGLHWERPARRPIVPNGEPGSDSEGGYYAAGSELVSFRPGEWSLPIAPQPVTHNQPVLPEAMDESPHRGYLWYATWRQDGMMSLEAEVESSFATVPLTFAGSRLELNLWTRFGGEIAVEVATASDATMYSLSEPIAGRSFAECDSISGDDLRRVVTWNGESDLSALAGKPVRLRFRMRRARLYAMQFT